MRHHCLFSFLSCFVPVLSPARLPVHSVRHCTLSPVRCISLHRTVLTNFISQVSSRIVCFEHCLLVWLTGRVAFFLSKIIHSASGESHGVPSRPARPRSPMSQPADTCPSLPVSPRPRHSALWMLRRVLECIKLYRLHGAPLGGSTVAFSASPSRRKGVSSHRVLAIVYS